MRHTRVLFLLGIGGLMLFVGGLLLLTPRPALASATSIHPLLGGPVLSNCKPGSLELQCGSQVSSCKNCHEVQAEKPVNNDGTGWHQSHAFGDFCTFCHAGNDQATDKVAAHMGMVPPLSDIKSACKQCHSEDLMARAQVYATVLNISLEGGAESTPNPSAPTNTPAAAGGAVQQAPTQAPVAQATVKAVSNAPANTEIVVNDPNTVDYVQRYNEIVLGERPVNWGNIILVVLIGLVVVGGGGFVLFNEIRLRLPSGAAVTPDGTYPADVVEMMPTLARLKLQTRQTLKHLLDNPAKADKVLNLVDTLVADDKPEERKS